VNRKPAMRRTN